MASSSMAARASLFSSEAVSSSASRKALRMLLPACSSVTVWMRRNFSATCFCSCADSRR